MRVGSRASARLRAATFAWTLTGIVCLYAQSLEMRVAGDAVRIQARNFSFLQGEPLQRLQDGRAVRFDLILSVTDEAGGSARTRIHQSFTFSYDLWEERYAVTQAGASEASISHLTRAAAEAWCLERLTIPLTSLGWLDESRRFWLRLEYRVPNEAPASDEVETFSLGRLVDLLSRRYRDDPGAAVEAGPFRLSD